MKFLRKSVFELLKAFETSQLLIHVYKLLCSCIWIKNVYGTFGLKASVYIVIMKVIWGTQCH